MVKMAPPRIFVALASMIAAASASYPELIPGEGLPSLAELGLTSEQLFTTPPPALAHRDNQYTKHTSYPVGEGAGRTASADNVIACFNYLVALGDYTCRERVLCHIGDAKITGMNKHYHGINLGVPTIYASVKCWDAALGLQWIFTNCNEGGQVIGYREVGGGDYVVAAFSSSLTFSGDSGDNSPVDLWKDE